MAISFRWCGVLSLLTWGTLGELGHCQRPAQNTAEVWEFLATKYDRNQDGQLTADEYDRGQAAFSQLDRNRDGVVTAADWSVDSQQAKAANRKRRQTPSDTAAPAVGQLAPDFELPLVKDSDRRVRLSSFAGQKPVALIFGSYT